MSMYIGNNGSEKVLHIYNGSTGVQKNIFSGTSFHSSMPYLYLSHKITFSLSSIDPVIKKEYNGVPYYLGYKANYSSNISLPSTFSFIIARGYKSGVYYYGQIALDQGSTRLPTAIGARKGRCPTYVINGPTSLSSVTEDWSSGKGVTMNDSTKFDAYDFSSVDLFVFTDTIVANAASDIKVSDAGIIVNGVDISTKKYLHFMTSYSDRVNDYDDILAIPYGGYVDASSNTSFEKNYVTSPNNIDFYNSISNSWTGHILVQVINSYPHAVTATRLSGKNSLISFVKNNIEIPIFKASTKFYTAMTAGANYRVLTGGPVYEESISVLIATTPLIKTSGIMLISIVSTGWQQPYMPSNKVVVPIINGLRTGVLVANYTILRLDIDLNSSLLRWYSVGGYDSPANGYSWAVNLDAQITYLQ